MSKEPDNLKMLREMRAELGDVREGVSDLNEKFGAMRKEIREGQETIATTAGFAMHANLRGQRLEEDPGSEAASRNAGKSVMSRISHAWRDAFARREGAWRLIVGARV